MSFTSGYAAANVHGAAQKLGILNCVDDPIVHHLATALSPNYVLLKPPNGEFKFAFGSVFRLEYHCIFIATIAVLGASGYFVAEQLNAKRDDKGGTPKVQPLMSRVASIDIINVHTTSAILFDPQANKANEI